MDRFFVKGSGARTAFRACPLAVPMAVAFLVLWSSAVGTVSGALARSAESLPIDVDAEILSGIRVPSWTVGLLGVEGRGRGAAQDVHSEGDGLEVCRVDTERVPTGVVDCEVVRDRPLCQFVSDPMCVLMPPHAVSALWAVTTASSALPDPTGLVFPLCVPGVKVGVVHGVGA